MPVPKRRTSRAKRDRRRSHDALKKPGFGTCSNCGTRTVPHRVCTACGHYGGRQIIDVSSPVNEE